MLCDVSHELEPVRKQQRKCAIFAHPIFLRYFKLKGKGGSPSHELHGTTHGTSTVLQHVATGTVELVVRWSPSGVRVPVGMCCNYCTETAWYSAVHYYITGISQAS